MTGPRADTGDIPEPRGARVLSTTTSSPSSSIPRTQTSSQARASSHPSPRTMAIFVIWSMVVVWVFHASLGALDGSQVAFYLRVTLGQWWWLGSGGVDVRERLQAVVERMDGLVAGRVAGIGSVGSGGLSLRESEGLCRCGGMLRLVMDYVEVIGSDGSRGGSGVDLGWVEGRLARPLGRGRAFGSAGSLDVSDTFGRYCQKEVIVKRVVYYDDDGLVERSLVAGGSLNLTGAVQVYKRVHEVASEYPEYSFYRDGMQRHVVVVDASGLDGKTGLVSPTVGVLSDGDALAVVAGKGIDGVDASGLDGTGEPSILPQVHEIDAWLYGPALGSVRDGAEIAKACAVEARHHATRLLRLLDEARHLRFDPKSSMWDVVVGGDIEGKGAFELASGLRAVLHSPAFGVEARMPGMHVWALMLPLGFPLVLQYVSNLKVLLKRRK